jgi:ubiquinone/menaquinone biosynthesis C-methylase UbiE
MCKWYEESAEKYTIQGTVTCAVMTEMIKADRVLEVACGPGKHSLMLSSTFLKVGGVLVSCDYSGEMVKRLAANYNSEEIDSDFRHVPGNIFI